MPTINYTIDKSIVSFGDTATVSFTIVNTMGATITAITANVSISEKDFSGNSSHTNGRFKTIKERTAVSIKNGKSMTFECTFTLSKKDNIAESFFDWQLDYPDVRSVPLYLDVTMTTTEYGNVGKTLAVTTLLDMHYNLSISTFNIERALSDGTLNDEGINALTDLSLYMNPDGNPSRTSLTLYFSENEDVNEDSSLIDLSDFIVDALSGITDSMELITDEFSKGSNWNFMLKFTDGYEVIYAYFNLSEAFANVHLSGAPTGGVAFGKFSSATEGNPLFECQYPSQFDAPAAFNEGIRGVTNYPEISTVGTGVEELTGGKWIDGKPIYRFVLTASISTVGNVSIGTLPSIPGAVISLKGMWLFARNNTWFILPHADHSTLNNVVAASVNGNTGVISLLIGSSITGAKTVNVIIEYTKVTD